MWLRDLLPQDVPRSRIFTYGYDSVVKENMSNSSILNYSRQLLELITCHLNCETISSPILFIQHKLRAGRCSDQ
jgi:hypothetical protein